MEKEIAIFKTDKETINVEVVFEDETVWLTQEQMAKMFEKAKSTINEHIKHIFEEGELDRTVAVRNFRMTTKHGAIEGKTQTHDVLYYNLDVIISVGYRVKSLRGTQFRQWATKTPERIYQKRLCLGRQPLKAAWRRRILAGASGKNPRHPGFRKSVLPAGSGYLRHEHRL